MSHGRQARWLAPIAVGAAFLAVIVMVMSASGGDSGDGPAARPATTGTERERPSTGARTSTEPASTEPRTTETTPEDGPRTHRVAPGDTFGSISQETGVPVEDLERLNPGVDSQSLTVGQRIRLR